MRGTVTAFVKAEGWGTISTPPVPSLVWVHFMHIDAVGFRAFDVGDEVELRIEEPRGGQDGHRYRATWARRIAPDAGD